MELWLEPRAARSGCRVTASNATADQASPFYPDKLCADYEERVKAQKKFAAGEFRFDRRKRSRFMFSSLRMTIVLLEVARSMRVTMRNVLAVGGVLLMIAAFSFFTRTFMTGNATGTPNGAVPAAHAGLGSSASPGGSVSTGDAGSPASIPATGQSPSLNAQPLIQSGQPGTVDVGLARRGQHEGSDRNERGG